MKLTIKKSLAFYNFFYKYQKAKRNYFFKVLNIHNINMYNISIKKYIRVQKMKSFDRLSHQKFDTIKIKPIVTKPIASSFGQ